LAAKILSRQYQIHAEMVWESSPGGTDPKGDTLQSMREGRARQVAFKVAPSLGATLTELFFYELRR
jgi:hypothetical protein